MKQFTEQQMTALRRMAKAVSRKCGAREDDALAEVWLAAAELAKYYRPSTKCPWANWVGRFVVPQACGEIHRKTIPVRAPSSMPETGLDEIMAKELSESRLDGTVQPADEAAMVSEERGTVQAAVATLPNGQRIVVVWRLGLDGNGPRTWPQIAAATGVSSSAVRERYRRALISLRFRLADGFAC
jgi:DNA-directed RNA polymerase specialized sigma24 family protein